MKILVIDDHALIRAGLRPVLEKLAPDGEAAVVLEASSYARGVEIAGENPDLDLVLLDFNLPNVTGFAALVDIQERFPEVPVVIVSGEDDPGLVRETFERGALGFIPKSSTTAVILSALRLVLSGGTYLPREIMASVAAAGPAPRPPANLRGLDITPRQAEVLDLILEGKSNKVICRELGLAEGTVKNHVAAVLKALNATNRVEAVIAAAKLGPRA
ncbi:MAG: response regulator transcription factor [Usitatibacter sp.]